ncbi:hypothetical protein AB6A40_010392 [Gnathostoma spinigerum]|uniref:Uncharacterized protein n=1 Tax=Gnathostoma spinigerum TaxID=75299 RepID=A0ABD6F1M9_9BILA
MAIHISSDLNESYAFIDIPIQFNAPITKKVYTAPMIVFFFPRNHDCHIRYHSTASLERPTNIAPSYITVPTTNNVHQ